MAVSFDLTGAVGMQQILSGPGIYNGSYVGRAFVDLGAGASLVRCRARQYGTDGNAITIELFDSGAPNVIPSTVVQLTSANVVRVILRRSAGALLATANEVALAINNFRNTSNVTQKLPIVATSGGAGVVVAVAPTALAGGLDPQIVAPLVKFTTIAAGGLFYFDQTEPLVVTQMMAKFAGLVAPVTIHFQIANLDAGLEPIVAETADIFTASVSPAQPYASFADAKFTLFPQQAFLVVGPALTIGMVQMQVQRLSAFLAQ